MYIISICACLYATLLISRICVRWPLACACGIRGKSSSAIAFTRPTRDYIIYTLMMKTTVISASRKKELYAICVFVYIHRDGVIMVFVFIFFKYIFKNWEEMFYIVRVHCIYLYIF